MDHRKRYRIRHRLAGLCASCTLPALPGRTYCDSHAQRNRERARAYHAKRKETVHA